MMEAEARQLLQRYGRSYFFEETAAGWFEANERGQRIRDRAVGGSKVSPPTGAELVAAMLDNVRAARKALEETAARMRRARQDGLLDREAMAGLPPDLKRAWISAVETVKGDYQRAVSELKHWQEYAEQARELPTLPTGVDVEALAESKALREPGEDDDEVPAHWSDTP